MHRFLLSEPSNKSVWVLAPDTGTNLEREWLLLVLLIFRLTEIVTDRRPVFPFSSFSTPHAKEGATHNWLLWVRWLKIAFRQHICWSHLLKLPLSYVCHNGCLLYHPTVNSIPMGFESRLSLSIILKVYESQWRQILQRIHSINRRFCICLAEMLLKLDEEC